MSPFDVIAAFFIVFGYVVSVGFFVLLFAWAINEAREWTKRKLAQRRLRGELDAFLADTLPPATIHPLAMARARREHRRAAL